MNTYTLHITLYDVLFFTMTIMGLTFAALLAFVQSVNRAANRFLALAMLVMVLWMIRLSSIHIQTDLLPMQFLLALGPLIYLYVRKITRPYDQFRRKDWLHFTPLLLELLLQRYPQLSQVLHPLIFISIIIYLQISQKLIHQFYRRLPVVLMDRSLLEFRWLRRLLTATALLWSLWIMEWALHYLVLGDQAEVHLYAPFYISFAVIMIWTATAAFLKPQAGVLVQSAGAVKAAPSAGLREKGAWLKKQMAAGQYHRDPELSLATLAGKLGLPARDLSQMVNTVFKKSFTDFINEYRVREVIVKMPMILSPSWVSPMNAVQFPGDLQPYFPAADGKKPRRIQKRAKKRALNT